jgi:general secretion pathway protein J
MKTLKSSSGFTLIEILIAMLILSIMAILMSRGLQIVMVSKDRIDAANVNLEGIQIALHTINQDLQQFVNRPVMGNDGNPEDAFTIKQSGGELSFTRGGYVNPEGLNKRSTLQRVRYKMSNDGLTRLTWPVLDRIASTPTYTRLLLPKANRLEWRFLANDKKFYTEWPQQGQQIPNGIEINLTLNDGKKIKQLFMLNTTSLPATQDDKTQTGAASTPNRH